MCSCFLVLSRIQAALFWISWSFWRVLLGGPNEEGVAVVESGGDERVDELLSIRYGEGGVESGNVF